MKVARFCTVFAAFGLSVLSLFVLTIKSCAGQDTDPEPHMSREEWLVSVEASRRRIDQMRQEHKSFLPPEPSPEDIAQDLAHQAMEDESLQAGDIIATQHGLLRFRGRPGAVHKPEDFIPLDKKQ